MKKILPILITAFLVVGFSGFGQGYIVPNYIPGTNIGTLEGVAQEMGISLDALLEVNPQYKDNRNFVISGAELNYPLLGSTIETLPKNYWVRTGSELSPKTANDDIDIGTGSYYGDGSTLTGVITSESDPLAWLQATAQTGLTGDKTGSFNLTTTGTLGAGAITGTSLTDGTLTIDNGSITGGVAATFSGLLTGGKLNIVGQSLSIGDVTGTPTGDWTKDASGYYYENYGQEYAIRVYAYYELDGVRVYSENPAQGELVYDPGDESGDTFYWTWSWNAVAGATGYRLLFYNSDSGWNYTYYQDVVGATTLVDGATGSINWVIGSTVTPTSAYGFSHLHESLAIDGSLTIGGTVVATETGSFESVNVTDGDTAYQVGGVTIMKFTNTSSSINSFFGANAGSGGAGNYGNLGGGYGALKSLTTGDGNVAWGNSAGASITTGSMNVLMGYGCASSMTAGNYNVFSGYNIGGYGTDLGSYNVMSGYNTALYMTGGSYNVVMGASAGQRIGGSSNIFLGYSAGSRETGSNKLIIDTTARNTSAEELANAIIYGVTSSDPTGQSLRFNADSITFNGGANSDIVFDFLGTTNSGQMSWMEDEDYFKFSDDILMNSTEAIYFRDTAIHIASLTDGHLDLTADISIDLNGLALSQNIQPITDNTYYLGKNDDDSPLAYKGVILKDTTNGKYYRIEVVSGVVTATDLTD